MAYGEAAPIYTEQGWNASFPLPHGQKYPPPDGTTGNHPDIDEGLIESWIEERADENIGLRMPRFRLDDDPVEVIGIDVDQYKNKSGWNTLLHLAERFGPLPATFKSSRHEPDNPSGIYFFLVPAGKKWQGKAGADIEIIQRTHRYAVAAPSVYEDTTYTWFSVPETEDGALAIPLDGPPPVEELPFLPDPWVEHLIKGNASERTRTGDTGISSSRAARDWMKSNLPGFDKPPSSEMARASNADDLAAEATGGAHDMIISRIHRCVMLAAEGHHGLAAALTSIQRAFYNEVSGEYDEDSERREMGAMRSEWDRALVGEIVKLKQDIDAGYMQVSSVGGLSADDAEIDTSAVIAKLATRRARPDARDYDRSDLGRAQMVLDHWNDELRPISESKNEWGMWNPARQRYERMPHERLVTDVWGPTIIEGYKEAATACFTDADLAHEAGDEEEEKKQAKEAMEFKRLAEVAGGRNTIVQGMSLAHSVSRHRISEADYDADPFLLGVGNGMLDFSTLHDDPAKYLREGTSSDLVFHNTGIDYVPGAESQLWKDTLEVFLPDRNYRRFVQRVLGYTLLGGNRERLIIFLQGPSSTGKSTISDAIRRALGKDYAATVAANALFREKQDAGPSPEMLKAMSRRACFSSEIGTHHRLHADVIKRITGGTDEIAARALYSNDVVERVPMFTPVIATNAMPTITDGDSALWRRVLVLPFDQQVPEGTVRTEDIGTNMAARQAVLAWLVDGLIDYLTHGLHPADWPDICKERNKLFVQGTSSFQTFVGTHLERTTDEKDRVEINRLFSYYQAWCAQEQMRTQDILIRSEFLRSMENNGWKTRVTSRRVEGKKNPQKCRVFYAVKVIGSVE